MPHSRIVTQTVILAAGHGSRLNNGDDTPKPLVNVGGAPLIAHALAHACASGCTSAVLVIGHQGEQIRRAVETNRSGLNGMRVQFIVNPRTAEPNGISLLAAESVAESTFFLQMVDHVFQGVVMPHLIADPLAAGEAGRLLVDRSPRGIDLTDATKVRLAGPSIVAIGKQVDPWDAIDTGCFVLTHAVFDALRRVHASEPRTVSSGMRQLAAMGSLGAVHLDGIPWVDVDTPADRDAAEELLAEAGTSTS
jgi:choline kinase